MSLRRSSGLTIVLAALQLPAAAYTSLIYDPSAGLNATRHGGSVGWVARWDLDSLPGGAIPYRVNPGFPPGVAPFAEPEHLVAVVREAFVVWEDVPTSAVRFRFDGLTDRADAFDGLNVVTTSPSFELPTEFPGGVFPVFWFAEPGRPVEPRESLRATAGETFFADCDLVINPVGRYSIADGAPLPSGAFDLRGILVHEIGHMLGLDHSAVGHSTMYAFATWGHGAHFSDLSTDDVLGITALYPETGALERLSRIEGRIVRESGEPLGGVSVVAVDAVTGCAVAGTISGVCHVRSDGVPDQYSMASGDYVLLLPPGRYVLFAEPFGGPGMGNPYLAGILGSASAGELFAPTDFSPALLARTVAATPGAAAKAQDIVVGRRDELAPAIGRRSSWMSVDGGKTWTDPARLERGRQYLLSLEAGQNLARPGTVAEGLRVFFWSPELRVSSVTATEDGRWLRLAVQVSPDAPAGPHVLVVSTPAGTAYFPGAVLVTGPASPGYS